MNIHYLGQIHYSGQSRYIKKSDRGELNKFLKGQGFKIFHRYIGGLLNNVEKVQLLLEETKKSIHILGISEPHLNADILDSQASVQDYTFIRKDRPREPGEV